MRSKRIGRRIPGVLGVKPLTIGFSQAEIKPQLGTGTATADLTAVSGSVPSILAWNCRNCPPPFGVGHPN
ncbi:MAG: hypothetical protein ABIS50_09210 [Luteolibacter sp.]|uniref:hypothetical protein n=1 Tax=Luteolibacter sp. TaxID=1962973 RepID=UPI003267D6FB